MPEVMRITLRAQAHLLKCPGPASIFVPAGCRVHEWQGADAGICANLFGFAATEPADCVAGF